MVTTKEVAKQAGAFILTDSHMINVTRSVNDKWRTRVLSPREGFGYQLNRIARSLRKKQTHSIRIGRTITFNVRLKARQSKQMMKKE